MFEFIAVYLSPKNTSDLKFDLEEMETASGDQPGMNSIEIRGSMFLSHQRPY